MCAAFEDQCGDIVEARYSLCFYGNGEPAGRQPRPPATVVRRQPWPCASAVR